MPGGGGRRMGSCWHVPAAGRARVVVCGAVEAAEAAGVGQGLALGGGGRMRCGGHVPASWRARVAVCQLMEAAPAARVAPGVSWCGECLTTG